SLRRPASIHHNFAQWLIPISDVGVFALTTGRSISPKRINIKFALLTGKPVLIGALPGIFRNIIALQIGAVPTDCVSWLAHQRFQSFFCSGKTTDIQLKNLCSLLEVTDLHLRRFAFSAA